MGTETERSYRVLGEAWRDAVVRTSRIRQGYLHLDERSQVRVRIRDERATLTVKRGGPGLERDEVEVDLVLEAAETLLSEARVGGLIVKRRHEIPIGELTVEVDEFDGEHAGLIVAEVELPDVTNPVPELGWLGEEVTGDHRFDNATLARRSSHGE